MFSCFGNCLCVSRCLDGSLDVRNISSCCNLLPFVKWKRVLKFQSKNK